jgi:hypothetical protein
MAGLLVNGGHYCRPWYLEQCVIPRQHNTTAMRDQHFQELMSKVDFYLLNGTPDTAKDVISSVEAKPEILDELSKQQSFREFIKRKLPSRKPSPELIQSIKDRIKVFDPQQQSSI